MPETWVRVRTYGGMVHISTVTISRTPDWSSAILFHSFEVQWGDGDSDTISYGGYESLVTDLKADGYTLYKEQGGLSG